MEPDISEEGKLWLGAITVAAWVIFCGAYVACEEEKRDRDRLRGRVEEALDFDYLLPGGKSEK